MWASTLLYCSALWVVNSRLHTALYEAALHWTPSSSSFSSSSSSAGSSSLVQLRLLISLCELTEELFWLCTCWFSKPRFSPMTPFWLQTMWFYLKLLTVSDTAEHLPLLVLVILLFFLVSPVMEILQTQIVQNSGFYFPFLSTWPPPPCRGEGWEGSYQCL